MYLVIVGNIGTVYEGDNYTLARETFQEYVNMSVSGHGRAANESVTLFANGEVFCEHAPSEEIVSA